MMWGGDIVAISLPTDFYMELILDEFRGKEVDVLESGFCNKNAREKYMYGMESVIREKESSVCFIFLKNKGVTKKKWRKDS